MELLKKLSFFFLVGIAYPSIGQMMQTRTTFNTASGKVENTMNPFYQPYYRDRKQTPKYDFTIVLNDDTSIMLRSSLKTKKKKTYVVYKAKNQKIFPDQTKRIYVGDGAQRIEGIAADSCWLFLVAQGRINCYTMFPTTDMNKTEAIQKGADGMILPFTKENLLEMVGTQDEKIKMLVDQYRFVKIIQYYNE